MGSESEDPVYSKKFESVTLFPCGDDLDLVYSLLIICFFCKRYYSHSSHLNPDLRTSLEGLPTRHEVSRSTLD